MKLRKANEADVEAATLILREAAQQMMDEGKHQWNETYPTAVHVKADIERGVGFVLEDDGVVIGYCAIILDGEPAYEVIDGRWLTDKPYVVAHRVAIKRCMKGCGKGREFMKLIENYAKGEGVGSFRIDTNYDNFSMLRLLTKLGFTYCGEISYESSLRKAFEKNLM